MKGFVSTVYTREVENGFFLFYTFRTNLNSEKDETSEKTAQILFS